MAKKPVIQQHIMRFKIEAYNPSTMPMARLAEYMGDLALLLGEVGSVHFVKLERGSTVLVQKIQPEALPKVQERTRRVAAMAGPPDAMKAYHQINKRLREDNGVGRILEGDGAEIIQFPGIQAIEEERFGPFFQEGTLDGVVIKLGGERDPVPVFLESESIIHKHCLASRNLARELGPHIFGPELRLQGTGKWMRDGSGEWLLEVFKITSFEPLKDAPLTSVVNELRAIPGSKWANIKDPWKALGELRHGPKTN